MSSQSISTNRAFKENPPVSVEKQVKIRFSDHSQTEALYETFVGDQHFQTF